MWKSMKNTDSEFMEYSSRVQEEGRCGDPRSKKRDASIITGWRVIVICDRDTLVLTVKSVSMCVRLMDLVEIMS